MAVVPGQPEHYCAYSILYMCIVRTVHTYITWVETWLANMTCMARVIAASSARARPAFVMITGSEI